MGVETHSVPLVLRPFSYGEHEHHTGDVEKILMVRLFYFGFWQIEADHGLFRRRHEHG